ncbi:hypothetical protein BMG03_12760 [Thioclava nitratireducens]|uniref:Uncharacterized protein n=1 Tax=Thioclava nitratireducens TaxID=1915078 RepID=A0ABN4X7W9_9RHOB|nr:hypothetical protein [Thioclava nitratireducens]AQS48565.1 hypothetical protein BMG03_12760 [Thioclava nitratireducens]
MVNITNLETTEARHAAVYTAEQHLRRHGASLCDLLDALDDKSGFGALCDLHSAFGQPIADPDIVERALRDIHRVLAGQAPSALERISRERGLHANDMTRWHGARISEIIARFRHGD